MTRGRSSTLYLARDELTREQAWDVVTWCLARDADEFTLSYLYVEGADTEAWRNINRLLSPFAHPQAPRELMSVLAGAPKVQQTELWSLCAASIVSLQRLLPEGPLAAPNVGAPDGWLEDLTIYRNGELLFGVSSHEGVGILELTTQERLSFIAHGLRSHDRPDLLR